MNGALVCLVSSWEDGDAVITNQDLESSLTFREIDLLLLLRCVLGSHSLVLCLIVLRWPGLGAAEAVSSWCRDVRSYAGASCIPEVLTARVCQRDGTPLDYTAGGDGDVLKNGVAGVEWGLVPYLQRGEGEGVSVRSEDTREEI